ncbi:MAG: SRPBCC family protein [Myxococcales bacterium]|nr:SRPBCC family protein [Myxococcales bacterium]
MERKVRPRHSRPARVRPTGTPGACRPRARNPPGPAGAETIGHQGDEFMTVLLNSIRIEAPSDKVWSVLATLDTLHHYDPGVTKSEITSPAREGVGASRRCDLAPGGWFKEQITEWVPASRWPSSSSNAPCRSGASRTATRW